MAGKHLSLEEAAKRLGVSVEEVNRLVDRKELFPMRSGGTIKFKLEEVERIANNLGASSSNPNDDLSLDLDLSAPGLGSGASGPGEGGESLIIGDTTDDDDDSIFSSGGRDVEPKESHTIIKGEGSAPGTGSGGFDVDDLGLDSLVGGSMVSSGGNTPSGPSVPADSGTMSIDLAIDGSIVGGSVAGMTAAGVSGVVDSGLSLEGSQIEASGIDLAHSIVSAGPSGTGDDLLGGSLAGDAFDLGADLADEESASVVIPTEETGDSSFFEAATDDSASVSFDGSSESVDFGDVAGVAFGGIDVVPASPPLTAWQVVGLVCSTFLLVLVGLVVFDVLQTVRAPHGTPVTAPVLNALTKAFGW